MTASSYSTREGTLYSTREGTLYSTREGTLYSTREGTPYSTRGARLIPRAGHALFHARGTMSTVERNLSIISLVGISR